MEIWKDIRDFEGDYQVSNYGRILSVYKKGTKKGRVLKPFKNPKGYLWVSLLKDGKEIRRQVHRIVMDSFRGASKLFVNHKDLNPKNNMLYNLEYVTNQENIIHAFQNNAFPSRKGEKNNRSKISDNQRLEIIQLGKEYPASFIANKYGLSVGHTQKIIREWGK